LIVLSAGCQDESEVGEQLGSSSFAESGGCNQVAFWAVDANATTAIWVSLDIGERRDYEETLDLPIPSSFVELRRGVGLRQSLCGDQITPPYQVDSTAKPVSGQLSLQIGPSPTNGCGTTGVVNLKDVTFDDGSVIDSLAIRTGAIGCFAG
jgi:hypothetical protein